MADFSLQGGSTMPQTATLRTLIQAPDLLVMPGIFDGFSAPLVEHSGFAAGFISGVGLSETLLGWSDVGLMGFELNLAAVTRLAACCTLPLLADADTGYGNAGNVYHTTRAFEQAGVAGLMIEDQPWPKRCGHMQSKEVITAEEMVEKVHAMCDARRDPAFVVMARTDALATHGLHEVLRRLALYAEVGTDLLFADALVSEPDIATVARSQAPLCEYGLWPPRRGDHAPDRPGAVTGPRGGCRDLSTAADGLCCPGDEARDCGLA
jgi:2-methylisocitrate lyase-like PEP mutase family enzyme